MPINQFQITACIVLYKNDFTMLKQAIDSFLTTKLNIKIFLVDNSPTNELSILAGNEHVEYKHNPSNPGFGTSHNLALDLAIKSGSKYHFIVNPDIYFNEDIITPMINYMEINTDVGMMMPEVLFPDGSVQFLPKLLPNPFWIIKRKFKSVGVFNNFINKYELREIPRKQIYNSPILSGCFSLLKLEVIKEIGGYDDSFFMYFEDFDLSRRIHKKYKTIYFPEVFIFHGYESGASKNLKLLSVFISSAFTYFNKWGWFVDRERNLMNNKTLAQFKS